MIEEKFKIVPLMTSANIGAATDCDSINMAGYHSATIIVTCGATTGAVTFTPTCGATEGAKTTAVPFKYAMGGAAIGTAVLGSTASCDVLSASLEHASTIALTCTTKMVVLYVDAANMLTQWLTVTCAATAGILHVVAILTPRYTGARSVTALK